MTLGPQETGTHRPSDRQRRQRARNLALLAVLSGLALLFFAVTIVKFGGVG